LGDTHILDADKQKSNDNPHEWSKRTGWEISCLNGLREPNQSSYHPENAGGRAKEEKRR
jgi:hypothetical protein